MTIRRSNSVFSWWGRFIFRHRLLVVGAWVLVLALSAVLAPRVNSDLKAGGFAELDSEAARGAEILARDLGISPSSLVIVFTSQTMTVDDPRFAREMEKVLSPLGQMPEVAGITTFYSSGDPRLVSADRGTTYATVSLVVSLDEARTLMPGIKGQITPEAREGLDIYITGQPAVFDDIEAVSRRDLTRAEMYAFPLLLLALVIAFGTLVAAGLTVAMGVTNLFVTLGIIYLLSQATDISMFVINIASMLGIGIAIDYSLVMVSRFREEIRRHSLEESIATTMSTAGKAVFFSALTTIIGFIGLTIFKFMMLRSLGVGGIVVIFISSLTALTLLPAILVLLGPRVNALRLLRSRKSAALSWHSFAMGVMRYPVVVLIVAVPALMVLAAPVLDIKLGGVGATVLPSSAPARQGYDILKEKFGEGETSPILVAVTAGGDILGREAVSDIYDLSMEIAALEGVRRVDSIVTLDPAISREQYQAMYSYPSQLDPRTAAMVRKLTGKGTTVLRVVSDHPPVSEEASALVQQIRALEKGDGLDVYVTGVTAEIADVVDNIYRIFPIVLIFVMGATYLALLVLFRSVIMPLKAVVMNAISVLAAYGAMVFVFQQGHGAGLLNFTAEGTIEATLPIILFCILFGLSMDYEVFMLTRMRESYLQTGDNRSSVAIGLDRTGRIVTSAALIMVLVSATFAFTDVLLVKAMGLGIAVAILVDATIVRALVVPAAMCLMGRWNWWLPAFRKRRPG